jgi:hypothetical protein
MLRPHVFCAAVLRCDNLKLDGGFGDEEAAEAVVDELDADEAFAGFAVAYVDDAALGGEVVLFVFATGARLGERDADVEVRADGYLKAGLEGGAAAAEIFAGCDFFEADAAGVATANRYRQTHGDASLSAGTSGG